MSLMSSVRMAPTTRLFDVSIRRVGQPELQREFRAVFQKHGRFTSAIRLVEGCGGKAAFDLAERLQDVLAGAERVRPKVRARAKRFAVCGASQRDSIRLPGMRAGDDVIGPRCGRLRVDGLHCHPFRARTCFAFGHGAADERVGVEQFEGELFVRHRGQAERQFLFQDERERGSEVNAHAIARVAIPSQPVPGTGIERDGDNRAVLRESQPKEVALKVDGIVEVLELEFAALQDELFAVWSEQFGGFAKRRSREAVLQSEPVSFLGRGLRGGHLGSHACLRAAWDWWNRSSASRVYSVENRSSNKPSRFPNSMRRASANCVPRTAISALLVASTENSPAGLSGRKHRLAAKSTAAFTSPLRHCPSAVRLSEGSFSVPMNLNDRRVLMPKPKSSPPQDGEEFSSAHRVRVRTVSAETEDAVCGSLGTTRGRRAIVLTGMGLCAVFGLIAVNASGLTSVAVCDRGLRVVSVTQQIDFNGAMGKMLAAVLLGVAEMEQETRRERQSAGIESAKQRGVYKGRKEGTRKAKPSRAQELRKCGLTDSEIATSLGISRRTVQRYLNAN